MPVAQLVQHFESFDHPSKMRRSSKLSFSSGRRLSLRTMFRSHTRMASSSSSGADTVSSAASGASPTLSTESFDLVSTSFSPQSERGSDPFATLLEFPERKVERSARTVKLQRAFSSTSLALQSEYKVDQFEVPGLDLFEPRPHNIFGSTQSLSEPAILDGIMEVMESG